MGMVILKQLEGSDPQTVQLADHAAPHGRPRRDAVTEQERVLRESEVYYAGDAPPTVHVFGERHEPLKLKGRFRDRRGGPGFAKAKAAEVERFFRAKRQMQLTWDDVFDVVGLMTRFTTMPEAPGEIPYEIEVKVTQDLLSGRKMVVPAIKGPADITNQIIAALKLKDKLPNEPPALKASVIDVLNGLVGDLNSASAALVEASDEIDSFATGTFEALQRFRAGLYQTRVAVQNLRGTYDSMLVSVALETESANQAQPFWDLQASWAASSLEALRLLALAEREAAKAEQGTILALHEAALGDTWEALAVQYYDSAARAQDIRVANGVEAGAEPVPGTVYLVPR